MIRLPQDKIASTYMTQQARCQQCKGTIFTKPGHNTTHNFISLTKKNKTKQKVTSILLHLTPASRE